MNYSLSKIQGIKAADKKKLAKAGIVTSNAAIKMLNTQAERKAVAKECGVDEKVLLEIANRADLMRIKGVGPEYSDLLENAGVDTIKELATRNVENLVVKMQEVNGPKKKFVKLVPGEKTTKGWVAHAKKLKPAISH